MLFHEKERLLEPQCCWYKGDVTSEECRSIGPADANLYASWDRRVMEKCLDCPRFASDIERMRGEGNPFFPLISLFLSEISDMKVRLQSMDGFLNSKTREIRFLHELSTVLQTSLDLDEVLSVAMTAITAGKGFGMNRAFLLMCDREQAHLRGYLGVGPRNYEEAWHIWQEVGQSDLSLREMAQQFRETKLSSEKVKFHDILEQLTVPLSDHDHIVNVALREKRPILAVESFNNPIVSREFAGILGVDSFLVMPLVSGDRRVGVILADNCITHRPITHQDIQSMETFAFPVAFALIRASLYEELQEEVDKLTTANTKLQEQQELIVKMEKMALVGRITSSIAHSIRNPLMVIGGFARSLLKNTKDDDPKNEYLGSIVQEAKQLEEVLEEILNYSDSLYPVKDRWDVNQLVSNVCSELGARFDAMKCRCVMELSAGLPAVLIDFKQISYCVKTLISSVLDNRIKGGEVVVRSWRWEGVVGIEVRDLNTTLAREVWESLSTPFSETRELGSGMGLPICRTILERSGHAFLLQYPADGGVRAIIEIRTDEGG